MNKTFFKILCLILAVSCTLLFSACGNEKNETAPTNCTHSFGEWETVKEAKSCTEPGEAIRKCSKCDHSERQDIIMEHTEVIDKGIAPSCTKKGISEGKHCSVCNTVIVAQEELPAAHTYVNGYKCKCGQYNEEGKIVIMSQNVRCADDGEGKNIRDRAPRFEQLVEKYQPDIIGTQETTFTWKSYFHKNLSDYEMVGCSREGKYVNDGEWSLILYRRDRFELLDSGDFWLSDTPNQVSVVEGSICKRICTWALLKDKVTEKTFVMANTHLDHSNDTVRTVQMNILLNELSDLIKDYPIFLTGDFNTVPTSSVYGTVTEKLSDASKTAAENKSTVDYTFDNYGKKNPGITIDYCFYNNKKADAFWFKIANELFDGYVSDHYAVIGEFLLK